MGYLIGIDVGTTGVKTLLIDEGGATIASAFAEYPLHSPYPAWAEQDPEDWWRATCRTIREVLQNSSINPSQLAGVSFSGQMHGSVFLDSNGEVIRPCILWCDQRTAKQCEEIIERVGQERLTELTCNTALAGFTAPKVLWLKEEEPENYARVRWLILPKDYVRYRLTGEILMEVSDAAGTLLFDVKQRRWSYELLEILDIDKSILPEWVESIDIAGKITPEAARITGLPEGLPVVAGGADNTCGAIGCGVVVQGRGLVSIGTSGVVFCPVESVKYDPLQRIHSFCHSVPNMWYLMGCMLMAGGSFRWFRDALGDREVEEAKKHGVDPYELLIDEAKGAPPGSEGLIFLPYLMGERSPHGDPNARGVFFGLTTRHSKAHLIRAVLEGVIFGLRDSLEVMRELGVEINELRATGGGAKSPFWRQIQADILNAPILTVNATEGPAFGAALIAGVGVGLYPNLLEACERTIKVVDKTTPIPENAELYNAYYEVFRQLYPSLKENFRRIVDTTNRYLKGD